jgi:hypothetical protein
MSAEDQHAINERREDTAVHVVTTILSIVDWIKLAMICTAPVASIAILVWRSAK